MLHNGGIKSIHNTKNNNKYEYKLNKSLKNEVDMIRQSNLINDMLCYINLILISKNSIL